MALYLYLARRDRKGMKLLCVLPGLSNFPPSRIKDISKLGLSPDGISKITSIIYRNRMFWEPWIEGANDYNALKQSIRSRGYSNVSVVPVPEYIENRLFVKKPKK